MTAFQSLGTLTRRAASQQVPVTGVGLDYAPSCDGGVDVWDVWATQPSVRKVVDFISSNIASIPLHVYRRASDVDRPRVTAGPLADLVRDPSGVRGMSAMRFWQRVLTDGLIHDRWAVMVVPDDPVRLVRIPPRRFTLVTDELDRVRAVRVTPEDGVPRDLDPSGFLLDVGYSQTSGQGTSPIRTLAALLAESAQSMAYRRQVMERAARHSGVISRGTPWPSKQARANFLESLRAFDQAGGRAGGTMLLDEGMEWHDRSYKPTDIGDLEARRLTDVEVASAYHIAPELLGVREGTYSNVAAFRQSLYRDNLGPYIDAWEQALAPLADMVQPGGGLYVEAAVERKLRGSFEEQAAVLQSSTGAPWLTRNEARARQNLPAVEGGDDLVTPLNVVVGGQASPSDSGSQNVDPSSPGHGQAPPKGRGRVLVKSADLEGRWAVKAVEVLGRCFTRQERAVTAAVGAKAAAWWDQERWDRELGEDLYRLAATCVEQMGRSAVSALGFDPDESWDQGRVLAYLQAVCKARARWVNEATRRQVEAALADADTDLAVVFERARSQRAEAGAGAFVAAMAGFAVVEAAKQAAPGFTVKTWVTGRNPRPSHAAMNGVSVPTGTDFPNGMSWPGDIAGGVDEVAGCNCQVALSAA